MLDYGGICKFWRFNDSDVDACGQDPHAYLTGTEIGVNGIPHPDVETIRATTGPANPNSSSNDVDSASAAYQAAIDDADDAVKGWVIALIIIAVLVVIGVVALIVCCVCGTAWCCKAAMKQDKEGGEPEKKLQMAAIEPDNDI